MQDDVDWIKKALAADPTKTQSGIANVLKVDKSAVSRLLSGGRQLKLSEAQLIAAYLKVDMPSGFREPEAPFLFEDSAEVANILQSSSAGGGFWSIDKKSVVGGRPRHDELRYAPYAFGVFTPDSAMAPRFKIGELLWINPAMPAGTGDDAVLMKRSAGDGVIELFPCELREVSDTQLLAFQFGRNEGRAFETSKWQAWRIMPRR